MNAAPDQIAAASAIGTVAALVRARAAVQPAALALVHGAREITYGELIMRVARLAAVLKARGLQRGDRIAVLSRNRPEYLEVELAAGQLGLITACLNWRLSPREVRACIELVSPKLLVVEDDLAASLTGTVDRLSLGEPYETTLQAQPPCDLVEAQAEDGLVILYTSGTTGPPKGAVISHRAMIARALVFVSELGLAPDASFIAWAPLFHMASTDHALATLLRGGTVVIIDGFQPEPFLAALQRFRIGWLVLIPGMVDALIAALEARPTRVKGVTACGAMADLVPAHALAHVTRLIGAPYLNTFGSTETGLPPATRGVLAAGELPARLSKQQSAFCEVKLVDADDNEVAPGEPGELAMRGPTLFSGYWGAHETNARDFRGGWFHMGDVFRRNADGTLDFVDRAKYMIKSGGENIYPAEIEHVLLGDPRVREAAVVRASDAKWGEVPVAFVACHDDAVTAPELRESCLANLARFKCPRDFHVIAFEAFPRSTSGKVQRHELEKLLRAM